jgi:hypothetical protein
MTTDSSTARRLEAAPADTTSLWGRAPVLQRRGTGFVGRILVEVWDDGASCLVASDLVSYQTALDALRYLTPLSAAEVALPALPITGIRSGALFLGRVIVESWQDQPVIGVFGEDKAGLVEHAIKKLNATIAAQGG